MVEALIGLFSGLAGVLVGALAEGIRAKAQYNREKRWSHVEERRRRIEETYETIEEHRSAYVGYGAQALHRIATGNLPDDFESKEVPWARLKMLVNLYVPELSSHVERLEKVGNEAGGTFAQAITRGGHKNEVGAKVMVAHRKLEQVYGEMTDELARLSQQLEKSVLPVA